MSQLADHLTKESVERLYEQFVKGIDYLQGLNRQSLGFNKRSFNDVGEPVLRWLHYKLMESAQWDPKAPHAAFPFKATRSMSEVVRAEVGVTEHAMYATFVGDSTRVLKVAGAIFIKGQSIWLRPWDGEVKLNWIPYTKVDEQVEKRIEEHADTPVNSYVDLRKFKVPDASPESVMEFITNFVPAAIKVQDDNTVLRQKVLELTNKLTELEEAAEAADTREAWKSVTDSLSEFLSNS